MTVQQAITLLIAKQGLGKLLGHVATVCHAEARQAAEHRDWVVREAWHIAGSKVEAIARAKNTGKLDLELANRRKLAGQTEIKGILDAE